MTGFRTYDQDRTYLNRRGGRENRRGACSGKAQGARKSTGAMTTTARKFSVVAKKNQRRANFSKTRSARRRRFRQKIIEIGAILAIFEPFEGWKIRVPLLGEFSRSSRDLYRNPL